LQSVRVDSRDLPAGRDRPVGRLARRDRVSESEVIGEAPPPVDRRAITLRDDDPTPTATARRQMTQAARKG
jgi:hypothetical protein